MNYLLESLKYVSSDEYFWIAMSLTSCIGIFIGSVLYDGVLREVKKAALAIISYAGLLLMTNLSRIVPILATEGNNTTNQPLAGSATILFVTLFYLFGMYLGVKITSHAHGGKER